MGNLNKVVYTDHQTVITADNLNNIQDAVIQNTSYTTCSTGASTAAKTATLANFVLTTGSAVKVKFTNTNTAANPTLNVNSTGAKPIMQYGTTVAGTTATESWDDGAVVEFVYDGTNWVMQGRNTIDAVSKANGGTFDGNVQINRADGTTSVTGTSTIRVGNDTATGADGNSKGRVIIYGEGTKYATLQASNVTGNQTIEMPNTSGTLMTDQGGTFIKPVIIDEHNGTASSVGASHLTLGNSTASGTAGNSTASLVMYGRQSYYIGLYTAETLTSNRSVYLPDLGGTIYVTNRIDGADGYGSATSIAAVRNFCDSLPERTCTNAVLVAGDIGYLTVFKATSNYCTIVRTSYNGPSYNSPVVMHSMQKYGGNWGPWVQIMGGAGATTSYTPTITAPSATGFSVDNVSFYYKITSDFLWINGRFRVVNHGTGNSNISISYPSGVTTIQGVGSFGTVHCNNSVNTSGLSLRPANDGKSMFIQSGAGNVIVNSIIPNGDYIVLQAMIPLR